MSVEEPMRNTQQKIMPFRASEINRPSGYDIYPFHKLENGKIFNGYTTLCDYISDNKVLVIDGYTGVYWKRFKVAIEEELTLKGLTVNFIESSIYLKGEDSIELLVRPFLGEDDSVWGTKTNLILADFFDLQSFQKRSPDPLADVNIVIGTGASLIKWNVPVLYVDLPKNELQHRMSAGVICNLGKEEAEEPTAMYKRFYFVDWVVLNKHKEDLLGKIHVFVDAQWEDQINWVKAPDILSALHKISSSIFRVRPWFAPGAWGGQWMKKSMPQLEQDEINYAWSFELIVPENGIVFESDDLLLEISFDWLMFAHHKSILGKHAEQFGMEFPIRFDFLDTFDGGNLSIQCHPSLNYIKQNFGENITQDETYYILDCKEGSKVYLGFQENIDANKFRTALELSNEASEHLAIEEYVLVHEAKKHDLFLIPNGTVHSAGADNLVLEISATPYIFTFKMYDWVRLDLNGKPRPINIEHAFNNLNFDRKGAKVNQELISKPYILTEDGDAICYHLPTHKAHFYDVHRHEFQSEIVIHTENIFHVLMLVEGTAVTVETADGSKMTFQFAETFVIPAAAGSYKLLNCGPQKAKVIKAFLK